MNDWFAWVPPLFCVCSWVGCDWPRARYSVVVVARLFSSVFWVIIWLRALGVVEFCSCGWVCGFSCARTLMVSCGF